MALQESEFRVVWRTPNDHFWLVKIPYSLPVILRYKKYHSQHPIDLGIIPTPEDQIWQVRGMSNTAIIEYLGFPVQRERRRDRPAILGEDLFADINRRWGKLDEYASGQLRLDLFVHHLMITRLLYRIWNPPLPEDQKRPRIRLNVDDRYRLLPQKMTADHSALTVKILDSALLSFSNSTRIID